MNKLKKFPYKRVLVLGLAKSGTATCNVLSRNGVHVIANDLKAKETDPEMAQLKAKGVKLVLGEHPLSLLDQVDLVIKNPGIPYHNEMISVAESKGIPVWTEIECLNYLIDNPIIAITGSNGKTTTTTLCHDILRKSQQSVQLAGNIGRVAIEVAEQLKDDEKLVLELSSFQLKGVKTFKPKIAVFLNLFEAHLDYHGDFLDYQQAKANIFARLTAEDYLVYNADDVRVSQLIQSSAATRIPFSTTTKRVDGAWADKTHIYFKEQKIMERSSIRLVGAHNLENILASVAATFLLGATVEGVRETLTTFNGVKHRLQFVAEKEGRLFYNDSKATNILASSKALTAFNKPVHLIAGGLDRGNGFDDLIPFLDHVKGMYLYGQTAGKLATAGKKAKVKEVLTGETLQDMVESAFKNAQPGEVILLSPACASWDQFKTFEERGDMFINLVHTL
ncbi:UDP-N-acetylmuramoyl-L-alanine--D-glutamate ligase [Amphibacillus cookii]|uniref:UDP-N-acetylmuramoyl-L-alanine--D-glutamate ligase n=1 Tax=Amphibacillus cookii TaxID=767787 RepID=UPI00195BE5BB|nr:UDP-N-acetylmuramoyl-L-alanine--D-glutamate ligase [Amphibacillus cookii]MBM7540478.1 UDP-N-acetylmuramoylalanine--D-glutamate ligase [Amphibacillus cookii]